MDYEVYKKKRRRNDGKFRSLRVFSKTIIAITIKSQPIEICNSGLW